jgi:hypothetical protein
MYRKREREALIYREREREGERKGIEKGKSSTLSS